MTLGFNEEKELSDTLKRIFTPTLLTLGLIGNFISILIFLKPSMRRHTTFRYLTFLSVFDLFALLTGYGQIFFIVYFQVDLRLIGSLTCKIHSFLVYFFTHLSTIVLALMSIDRALVITTQSDSVSKLSTPQMVNKFILIASILIALVNSHFLVFTQLVEIPLGDASTNLTNSSLLNASFSAIDSAHPNLSTQNVTVLHKLCYAQPETIYYYFLIDYFPWIDLILYAIFPGVVMLTCSAIIIYKIFDTNKKLNTHGNFNEQISRKRLSKNKQITYLLLATNFLFLFLVSPLVAFNAMNQIHEETVRATIIYFLSYSNHALNFIFYGITSEKYRCELFQLLLKSDLKQNYETVRSLIILENKKVNPLPASQTGL